MCRAVETNCLRGYPDSGGKGTRIVYLVKIQMPECKVYSIRSTKFN